HGHAPAQVRPLAELVGVPDGGGQDDELRARVEADDRLLPHVPALGVVEVVTLVHHHHVGGLLYPLAEDAVPQDLGDDDLHRGVPPHLVVARREPDLVGAEIGLELAELLLGERAQRRRVHRGLPLRQRLEDRRLGDERLARSRRHGDEHALAREDVPQRPLLRRVRLQARGEEEPVVEVVLDVHAHIRAKATAISAATRALDTASTSLAVTVAPPVACSSSRRRNGVSALPRTPADAARSSAFATTSSTSLGSSAAWAGMGLHTSTPPWPSSKRARRTAATSSTVSTRCSSGIPLHGV